MPSMTHSISTFRLIVPSSAIWGSSVPMNGKLPIPDAGVDATGGAT